MRILKDLMSRGTLSEDEEVILIRVDQIEIWVHETSEEDLMVILLDYARLKGIEDER